LASMARERGWDSPVRVVVSRTRRAPTTAGSGPVAMWMSLPRRVMASLPVLSDTIPVGPRAWWTALTPDGSRLYVTVGRGGDVAIVDTAAGKVVGRVAAGKLPWGIAIVDVP